MRTRTVILPLVALVFGVVLTYVSWGCNTVGGADKDSPRESENLQDAARQRNPPAEDCRHGGGFGELSVELSFQWRNGGSGPPFHYFDSAIRLVIGNTERRDQCERCGTRERRIPISASEAPSFVR